MAMAEATIIKGGAMIATGGLVADLIIFNDPAYMQLSIVGAIVSASGVIHEITEKGDMVKLRAFAEVLKGVILGLLAIPFWYLLLSDIGSHLVYKMLDIEGVDRVSRSVWLMVSFGMAWYTVPIFNGIVKAVEVIIKFFLKRFLGGVK